MNALGIIELNSIPKGIEVADAMLKAADVSVVMSQAVCAGKYIVVMAGTVSAVEASTKVGAAIAESRLVDETVIPNVHEQVIAAVAACTDVTRLKAVGAIETFSLASAVVAADTAVKAAEVTLIEIRLGRGLGGKSFVLLTGDVAAAEAAVAAAQNAEGVDGLINDCVVIPSPHEDLMDVIL